jgi:hypothetical protein
MAEPTGLTELGLAVAPNPVVRGHAVLSHSPGVAGPVTVRMYDVMGRNVLTRALSFGGEASGVSLDLRGLSAGVYLLVLASDGRQATRKLVIEQTETTR